MPRKATAIPDRRAQLLDDISHLAEIAIFGTLSETYRTCGTASCHCRSTGPKHGPHLYMSYRSDGKTSGYYVPQAAQSDVRDGVAAWQTLQVRLRELASLNKERALAIAKATLERSSEAS